MEFDDGNRTFTLGTNPWYVRVTGHQLVEWCPFCYAQTGEKIGVGAVKISPNQNRYQPCLSGNHGIFFPRLPTALEIENGLQPPVLPPLTDRGIIPGGKRRCAEPRCTKARGNVKCSTARCAACCTEAAEQENGRDGRVLCAIHHKQINKAIDKLEQDQVDIGLFAQQQWEPIQLEAQQAGPAEGSCPVSPHLSPQQYPPSPPPALTPNLSLTPAPSPPHPAPPALPPSPPPLPPALPTPPVSAFPVNKGKGKAEDARLNTSTQRAHRQTGLVSNAVPGPSQPRMTASGPGTSMSPHLTGSSQRPPSTQSSLVPHKRKPETQIGPSKAKSARSGPSNGVVIKGLDDFLNDPLPKPTSLAPPRPVIKEHAGDSFLCRLPFGDVARGMDAMRLLCTIRGMDIQTAFSKVFTGSDAIYKSSTFKRHRETYFWTKPDTIMAWKEREGGRTWKEFYTMRTAGLDDAEASVNGWEATPQELREKKAKKKEVLLEKKMAKAARIAHRVARRTKLDVKVESADDLEDLGSEDEDELESAEEWSGKEEEEEEEEFESVGKERVKVELEDVLLPNEHSAPRRTVTRGKISVPKDVKDNMIEILDNGYMLDGVLNLYNSDSN